jgi:hypothetical protein
MIPRHLGYEFIIFAIVCTVAIFAFPAATGSYSAVHGPVTALLSLRARLKLWLGMAVAALQWARVIPISFSAQRTARQMILLSQSVPPEQSTILRC